MNHRDSPENCQPYIDCGGLCAAWQGSQIIFQITHKADRGFWCLVSDVVLCLYHGIFEGLIRNQVHNQSVDVINHSYHPY